MPRPKKENFSEPKKRKPTKRNVKKGGAGDDECMICYEPVLIENGPAPFIAYHSVSTTDGSVVNHVICGSCYAKSVTKEVGVGYQIDCCFCRQSFIAYPAPVEYKEEFPVDGEYCTILKMISDLYANYKNATTQLIHPQNWTLAGAVMVYALKDYFQNHQYVKAYLRKVIKAHYIFTMRNTVDSHMKFIELNPIFLLILAFKTNGHRRFNLEWANTLHKDIAKCVQAAESQNVMSLFLYNACSVVVNDPSDKLREQSKWKFSSIIASYDAFMHGIVNITDEEPKQHRIIYAELQKANVGSLWL